MMLEGSRLFGSFTKARFIKVNQMVLAAKLELSRLITHLLDTLPAMVTHKRELDYTTKING